MSQSDGECERQLVVNRRRFRWTAHAAYRLPYDIDNFEAMNKIFKTYFPNGGPARTTVAVRRFPGNSLVEINCIAAITKKQTKRSGDQS